MKRPKKLNLMYQLHNIVADTYILNNSRIYIPLKSVYRKIDRYRDSRKMEL